MDIFGWFESPYQEKPAHDPGLDVPCPFCLKKLERPVMSISLLREGDGRSYFYRAHKACYSTATIHECKQIEESLIDAPLTNAEEKPQ
jgi:hypothetical protein